MFQVGVPFVEVGLELWITRDELRVYGSLELLIRGEGTRIVAGLRFSVCLRCSRSQLLRQLLPRLLAIT